MFYFSRIGGSDFLYNNGNVVLDKKPNKEPVGTSILLDELMIHT